MIELRFEEFHDHNYEDKGFCLYVMKNGLDDVLYIIRTTGLWGCTELFDFMRSFELEVQDFGEIVRMV